MSLPESIAPALSGALAARGYNTLTAVQNAVLAPETLHADLLVSAQTGSGKTVAFGLAMASTILGDELRFGNPGAPLAMIIAPTRELALQVQRELEWLYADTGARIASCVGGMDIRSERRVLERGSHIVVGTPGRLRDHITRNALDMSELRVVVLDEADEMLDMGFREDLEFILGEAPADRRTLMFSATVPKPIAQLAKRFQKDALRISAAGEAGQHADIDYFAMPVPPQERDHAIINTLLYYDAQNSIIFCSTREAVKHMASRLSNRGFAVVALSGELSQAERNNALQSMRDGRARVCVATDVAARGIDLPNLDLVIHADLPNNAETMLHRSGRTGRAGRKGTCVLVVPFSRRRIAERLLHMAKLDAQTVPAPGIAAVQAKNNERILNGEAFNQPVEEEHQELLKALTERYTPEQIASAFLNRELAALPAAEEVSDAPVHPVGGKKPRERSERGDRPERGERFDRGDRAEQGERFDRNARFDGVWFSVSAGRKHRADPKWLLPLICKAGDVSKREVGSIKIFDNETRFEIVASKADEFRRSVEERGTGEKGLVIRPAVAGAGGDAAPREGKRDFKPRSDKPRSDFRDGPRDNNRDNAKNSWAKPKGDFKKDGFKKDGKSGYPKKNRGE
ncbi:MULTISPECIES: DEAD/DEAH box helicase [Ochrobactrum]|uniref:DEAD/DEAH box helicase n=1 Tax=Ochrobactrum quorumnocens TaxID=271865 RepID=A0A5N1JX37_9HYPH|nr:MULTISPECIES: DEAD/DEAH box helicase [Brucella/Ochrobactrum group]KAA9366841.1 DEAD/DEAH box helicase [[Ochrobactrum] quorumnocens]MBD7992254.1 DEAD/DEAH box helicase [Ochrobactrum gallinarum]MCV9906411.1 DEAD/DEAH box helicase [Brucella sp. HL-2]MDH7789996.1 ATP-dependent RNA helicase DeaD [Ochrobactrum sp. AN78]